MKENKKKILLRVFLLAIFGLSIFLFSLTISQSRYLESYKAELEELDSQIQADEENLQELYSSIEEDLYSLDIIYRLADEYDIAPELILAMIKVESNFYQFEETGICKGYMQISDIHNVANIFDLEVNIRTGTSLISGLRAESENMYQALGKYNRGKAGYSDYVQLTGTEVTDYATKVLGLVDELSNGKMCY
jgi:soluble lytic murein transglycosylase-like protein